MALEYYFLFFAVSFFSLTYEYENKVGKQKKGSYYFHSLFIFLLILLIGFRFEVGGDWSSYRFFYDRAQSTIVTEYFTVNEAGYAFINYISSLLSGGILLVNILCAVIFVYFFYNFINTLPRPWLSLVIAIPYFIIVISMGFVRQGLAIAIFMYAITFIEKKNYKSYIFFTLLASTFHLSALAFIPVILLQFLYKKIFSAFFIFIFVTIIFYINYDFILAKSADYFLSGMTSDGAFIRSLMNLLPALIFILFMKKFRIQKNEKLFWFQLSIIAIIFSILLIFYPNFTIIDRLGYYLISLQIFVFTFLPGVFGIYSKKNKVWVILIIFYYFLVLLVWQNFASHNYAWIPYKSYFFNLNW